MSDTRNSVIDPDSLSAGIRAWLADEPLLIEGADRAIEAFCRGQIQRATEPGALAAKLVHELGRKPWRPLGRVLAVVSENDVLGTIGVLIGLCLTGNRGRIKARKSAPMLRSLLAALGLERAFEIVDFSSSDQNNNDELEGIDAVVLAGPAALIRHYRKRTPVGVRLIEFGPKLSAAAIGPGADVERVAADLVFDHVLFGGHVCSTPQFIFVDEALASKLNRAIRDALHAPASAPEPRPWTERLVTTSAIAEWRCLRLLEAAVPAELWLDDSSGWAITVAADPTAHPVPGPCFRLVPGDLAASLARFAANHRGHLQTLSSAGKVPESAGFTRRCDVGQAHHRGLLEPHDGIFELAALVNFVTEQHLEKGVRRCAINDPSSSPARPVSSALSSRTVSLNLASTSQR